MRKINIGFISPYKAMMPLIDELRGFQDDLVIEAAIGNLQAGVDAALELEENGADILISRGGTAKMIREAVSLPVVDVHISGYDLLRSIMLAEGHSNEKKALVGFSNITMGAESIVSLLEIELEVVTLSSALEVQQVLRELKDRGFKQVLGDVVTIEAAASIGLDGLLIQSGRETLLDSFEEARQLFKSLEKNQQQLRALEQLLEVWHKDVIILEETGKILFENFSNFKKSPISEKELWEMHQQVAASGKAQLKLYKEASKPFCVKVDLFDDRNGSLTVFSFDQSVLDKKAAKAMRVEQPTKLPTLVTESGLLKDIQTLIEGSAIIQEPLVLIGREGTGKRTMAEYMHVFHEKNGLFIQLNVEELEIRLAELDIPANSTLLINFIRTPTEQAIRKVKELITSSSMPNVQLVLSMPVYLKTLLEELDLHEAIKLQLPPLAERKEDIPFLVRQFLTEYHQTLGTPSVRVREDAMQLLTEYSWPGNLHEMKAYVKRMAIAEKDYVIEKHTVQVVPFDWNGDSDEVEFSLHPKDNLKEIERKIIEQVLKEENYNQTKAAKRLEINRATLWRKLKN